ncbi:MAG TPA: VOC family protein [Gemmatimonadales bacterium]
MASDTVRGRFLWHELMTSDTAAAAGFYGALVGWGTQPLGDGSYTLFTMGERPRAGMMALTPELVAQEVPPHWLCYFGAANCDAATAEAERHGASVIRPPADIPEYGRFAVISDPQGAVCCLYQPPAGPMGDAPAPGLGDFTWHELATTDVDGAFRFYGALFGWAKVASVDMGEMGIYHEFAQSDGAVCGGIYLKPAEVPYSNWLPYACVPRADAAAEVVTAKGGTILVPPMDVPGGDRAMVLMDPQGAAFAVHAKRK